MRFEIWDLRFEAKSKRPKNCCYRHFSFAVNFHADGAVRVGFKFKPGAPVGDDFRPEKFAATVILGGEKNARRPDKLGNNNALNAINNKSPPPGHQRKISQINFLLFYFACFFVGKADLRAQRRFK